MFKHLKKIYADFKGVCLPHWLEVWTLALEETGNKGDQLCNVEDMFFRLIL